MATLNNRVNTSVNSATRTLDRHQRQLLAGLQPQPTRRPDRSRRDTAGCSTRRSGRSTSPPPTTVDHERLRRPAERSGSGVRRPAGDPAARGARLPVHASLVRQLRRQPEHGAAAVGLRLRSASRRRRPHAAARRTAAAADLRVHGPEPAVLHDVAVLHVQKASNFGDVSDVYTGYDFNANARLPRGGIASGGVSIGHEVTDICEVVGQASVTYAAVAGVLASSAGHAAAIRMRFRRDHAEHAVLPRRAAVPARRQGAGQLSAAVVGPQRQRHDPEPSGTADSRRPTRSPAPRSRTWADARRRAATRRALIQPRSLYGDRFTQVDVRFGKNFRLQRSRSVPPSTSTTC